MTMSRRSQVDLSVTPYYHLISRCVRRAYLCGRDVVSGRSFDHRKKWLVDRIRFLGEVFAADVCAYAVMSNHFHLVVRMDSERAYGWSEEELLERYGKLFGGSVGMLAGLGQRERAQQLAVFRERLCDVSWMMRALNEWMARRANREDECKGRFWEGRFKSQALLDERAVLTCMSYVDLNPVRAGVAKGLEDSEFTSIQERLREVSSARRASAEKRSAGSPLAPFIDQVPVTRGRASADVPGAVQPIAMLFADYVELLDYTGRALLATKPGAIRGAPPRALAKAKIDTARWLDTMRSMTDCFGPTTAIGTSERLDAHAQHRGVCKVRGKRWAAQLYGEAA